ncbi:DUF4913 domain-containing protein [Nocardia sp. NPDC004151]|uniref:DUF4913 domain-containing protein n=1 Tax=Nocardia sp. NPDC004151 TaxID=3364304 RepID=UPI0036789D61
MTATENTTPEPAADNEADNEAGTETAEAIAAEVIPAEHLGELLEDAIRKAVGAQIGAKAKKIAEGVVATMLTPEVVAGMRETAIYEAELALNPPVVVEPEPGPEPEPVVEAEEEQPEPPQKEYRSLKAFVENYVTQIYRREVSKPGSEKTLRWCPEWWKHGEAVGRFSAMWRAFEALRQGETVEPSKWWTDHFDPHMDRLLDTQFGAFKYCSVAEGHKDKLCKLPCTPAPESVFGEAADETPATDNPFEYITAAGFYVPEQRPVRSRIAWEIPE